MKSLVSVIIPAYNAEKFIEEAIKSAQNQTYKNIEIIVVDDGSTDGTAEIVKKLAKKDKRIRYHHQKNKGVSIARNTAINYSKGQFIALLDQDDIWLPEKIKEQMILFDKNKRLVLVFSNAIFFEEGKGGLYLVLRKQRPRGRIFRDLLKHNFIPCPTAVIKKSVLSQLGEGFDEELRMVEDYDLFLRVAYVGRVDYIDKPLAKWRRHKGNFTYNHRELLFLEREHILKKFKDTYPDFEDDYADEIKHFKRRTDYEKAVYAWQNKNFKSARKYIKQYIFGDLKYLIAYVFMLFPYRYFEFLDMCYNKAMSRNWRRIINE